MVVSRLRLSDENRDDNIAEILCEFCEVSDNEAFGLKHLKASCDCGCDLLKHLVTTSSILSHSHSLSKEMK